MSNLTRRQILASTTAAAAGGSLLASSAATAQAADVKTPGKFIYCLNMSTIMGQELTLEEDIDVAGNAGYDAIEPWFRKINPWVEAGGKLSELKKRIDGHGLTIESAIGFAPWVVDDEDKRKAGLEEAKRDMDTIAQLGGKRIAAPPAGTRDPVDLDKAGARYRQLLELGDEMGVVPQVEMWGGHPTIGTVEKAVYIALAAGHPQACFLGDAYHTYKGGSSFDAFRMLGSHSIQTFHINDYPADPPRETIKDEHRVYPGDGIAPVVELLKTFAELGAYPSLSLEVFNKTYWAQPADEVAKVGLEKTKACVAAAIGNA
ncbi:MAG: 2-keto-myo-inositol isomerase [Verrucomicrobiales bacterium]|jgi:2-keto-myo-inositol isomerase